jgi:hypothetical protein
MNWKVIRIWLQRTWRVSYAIETDLSSPASRYYGSGLARAVNGWQLLPGPCRTIYVVGTDGIVSIRASYTTIYVVAGGKNVYFMARGGAAHGRVKVIH